MKKFVMLLKDEIKEAGALCSYAFFIVYGMCYGIFMTLIVTKGYEPFATFAVVSRPFALVTLGIIFAVWLFITIALVLGLIAFQLFLKLKKASGQES